jgi:hypothetical protein
MSNEARELKEYIRWLEDGLGGLNNIEGRLDNIESQIDEISDRLDTTAKSISDICDVLREQCAVQRHLADYILKLADALAPKSPPEPMASVFNEIFPAMAPRPKRPTRQKFKPKVVADSDLPDGPGAA